MKPVSAASMRFAGIYQTHVPAGTEATYLPQYSRMIAHHERIQPSEVLGLNINIQTAKRDDSGKVVPNTTTSFLTWVTPPHIDALYDKMEALTGGRPLPLRNFRLFPLLLQNGMSSLLDTAVVDLAQELKGTKAFEYLDPPEGALPQSDDITDEKGLPDFSKLPFERFDMGA